MSTRDDLFQRGQAMRQSLEHLAYATPGPSASHSAPGGWQLTTELIFGGVWSRPGLSLPHRMTCTLSVLTVLQRLAQLRVYMHCALSIGMSPRTIQEIVMQNGLYGGFPTMVSSLRLAKEIFDERGVEVPETDLPHLSLEDLERQGRDLRRDLQGADGQSAYAASDTHLAADLFQLALQYGYGELWHRPDLDRPSRVVCALAAFTALGGCEPQLRGFLRAALNVGFDKPAIVEILIQAAPYGGFPRALNALSIAQEVL